ncbi:TPA: HNH endonuclease [Raoultella ornithinolytica]
MKSKAPPDINIINENFSYNPETGVFIRIKSKTRPDSIGKSAGYIAKEGYVVISLGRESYKAHRLAWLVTYGEWPDEDIDHVVRDKSNNKIVNLRKASRSMNCANVGLRSHNTSGYRGVSFNAQWGRWFAQIIVGGEKRFLGYFESAEKASEAYVLAAKEAFGEYFPS